MAPSLSIELRVTTIFRTHAIIEVKHQNAPSSGIRKDLDTLSLFVNAVGYERAIYLVYGFDIDPEKLFDKISSFAKDMKGLADIEVWFQLSDSSEAFHFKTIEKSA